MTYNKEQFEFINKLKGDLKDTNHEIIGDYFYEWKIENWNEISKEECVYSPEFNAYGQKWKLELYPDGCDDFYRGNISLFLYKDDSNDDCSVHLPLNRVFFIRNYYDNNYYHSATLPIEYLSKSICSCGHPNLLNTSQLRVKSEYSKRSLIENNKCVFGVYFVIYKNERGFLKKELACNIDDEDKIVQNEGFYEWEVNNWGNDRSYDTSPEKSPSFTVGNHRWNIELYKNGDGPDNKRYVSVYLKCLNPELYESEGTWVNGVLFVRNCDEDTDCFYFDTLEFRNFNKNNVDWGFPQLIKKKELYVKSKSSYKSIIEKDKCIIGAYFHIYGKGKNKIELENQTLNDSMNKPTSSDQPLPPYSVSDNSYSNPSSNSASNTQYPPYPNPPYSNPPYSNSPYPNPPYPNPQYPNPQYPNPQYQYPPYQYPGPYYYPGNAYPVPNLAESPAPNLNNGPQYPPFPNPSYQYPPYQGPSNSNSSNQEPPPYSPFNANSSQGPSAPPSNN